MLMLGLKGLIFFVGVVSMLCVMVIHSRVALFKQTNCSPTVDGVCASGQFN